MFHSFSIEVVDCACLKCDFIFLFVFNSLSKDMLSFRKLIVLFLLLAFVIKSWVQAFWGFVAAVVGIIVISSVLRNGEYACYFFHSWAGF